MVFSSHIFLFYFFPIFILLYYILVFTRTNISWTNLFVTIASYIFYGWFEPWFVSLMWISTIVDYACGRAITQPEKVTEPRHRNMKEIMGEFGSINIFYPFFFVLGMVTSAMVRSPEKQRKIIRNSALIVSMVVNLGLLGFFKYYMFFMDGINRVAELFGGGSGLFYIMNITLPIGISFYTFQTMSYTIDVWRGDAPPVKDMRTFSCFVALFPQLIAGPIVRYNTIADQLANRRHSLELFTSGTALFIMGLAKKILLANPAGEVADAVFRSDAPGVLTAWWGGLGYSFQIYFDFAAYSDMAVGLGRIMGFEFIKNFNAPYRSTGISDFWNRWHISLSTWIRDYLYIALGGNRRGPKRTYFNLMIAMFLCGLWHGAKMTFVIWGVYHAVLLIWERTMGRRPIYHRMPTVVKIIITNAIVIIGWVIFRAPSMDQALHFLGGMFGIVPASPAAPLLAAKVFSVRHIVEMAICIIFTWQPVKSYDWIENLTPFKFVILIILLFLSVTMMFTQAFNPFLYFQF